MPSIVIIPSRYASTRFPGKPLCLLSGKPLIQHVYERSKKATIVQEVFVATDSKLIYDFVEGFGGKAIMTSESHQSGTDRLAEAVEKLQTAGCRLQATDIIVNVQGDEPMIHPQMIDDVIGLMGDERASIGTLTKRIEETEEILDPNIVKVVFNSEGFALYFSRSPIPYHRDFPEIVDTKHYAVSSKEKESPKGAYCVVPTAYYFYKHIGIYAYRKDVLLSLSKLPSTRLEEIERLEQLRALENSLRIKVKETLFDTIGVDTPADIERAEKCLSTFL
jgi:3-deoxy-manno-octulosonate cytidylyltransferase (CMP-KDO synthetase)